MRSQKKAKTSWCGRDSMIMILLLLINGRKEREGFAGGKRHAKRSDTEHKQQKPQLMRLDSP